MSHPMNMNISLSDPLSPRRIAAICLFGCLVAGPLGAQPAATAEPPNAAAQSPAIAKPLLELNSLAWLDGCWRGDVSQYEFREHWLPLRGGLMVGAGHVTFQGKTQDYGYLRLETRPDGVYYVSISSARKEMSFKLTETAVDDKDTIFTFVNPVDEFPQRVIYRRGKDGWLYATVEGKVNGEDKKVIYPMRRVDCQGGALLRN
jgi:Domain of unknown function (DUF6265)